MATQQTTTTSPGIGHSTDSPPRVTRDRFDAVLFDLDGVLTSTATIHAAAWKQMFDDYLTQQRPPGADDRNEHKNLRPFDITSDYKRYVDGKPRYEGVKSFLESRDIHLPWGHPDEPPGDQTVCGLANRKDAMVKQAIDNGGVQAFEGSIRWARQLKADGFKLAVVSSSRNCGPVLKAAGIDSLFDVRVDGETLLQLNLPGKPAPDSFLKAAQELGVPPDRAVVVEDAISGVQAAQAGHFALIIGVDREGHLEALRQHGAHIIVHDLGELASPSI